MSHFKIQTSLYLRYLWRFGLINGCVSYFRVRFSHDLVQINLSTLDFPITLRARSSDVNVFDQMFLFREYQLSLNYTPRFILDLGSHIGLAAVWFANQFPDAAIVSVEPDKRNYELLVLNTKFYPQITTIKSAIWSESCHLKIVESGGGFWATQVQKCSLTEPEAFPSISISNILDQSDFYEIDILKIDIETAEKEVFSHNFEKWLPQVKILFIELHDTLSLGCSKAVFNAISKYEFSCFPNGEGLLFVRDDIMGCLCR